MKENLKIMKDVGSELRGEKMALFMKEIFLQG